MSSFRFIDDAMGGGVFSGSLSHFRVAAGNAHAFVTFHQEADAEAAIKELHGHILIPPNPRK